MLPGAQRTRSADVVKMASQLGRRARNQNAAATTTGSSRASCRRRRHNGRGDAYGKGHVCWGPDEEVVGGRSSMCFGVKCRKHTRACKLQIDVQNGGPSCEPIRLGRFRLGPC